MASMHYLSMLSLRLEHAAVHPAAKPQLLPETLALIVALVSLLVVVVVLGLARRYRDLWQAVAVRDARLVAMINTARHGVVTINTQGLVKDFNPAAQQIFGYSRDEVLGRNVSMLMPSPPWRISTTPMCKSTPTSPTSRLAPTAARCRACARTGA